MSKTNIAILGSTGSIGTQTVDVIERYPDLFHAAVLTANDSWELLAEQAVRLRAEDIVICNPDRYDALKSRLEGTRIRVHSGMDAVCSLVRSENIDVVVGAMVGFSGLRSTIEALESGKTVALANKETLVAAGSLVTKTAARCGGRIIPVDSEHSAIFQCLQGNKDNKVVKIHLTASGGPFRTLRREDIALSKSCDALKHPNWNMGAKVTIDSATMMNKGLEVIEAKWLFNVNPEDINVIVHPQSIIHSMVEYEDGAVIAQLGCPDMREPIQYALTYPKRIPLNNKKIYFFELGQLDFYAPDFEKFPCLALAFKSIEKGGTTTVSMNAANEIAVKAYLENRISFYDIPAVIEDTIARSTFKQDPDLDDIFASNEESLTIAKGLLR